MDYLIDGLSEGQVVDIQSRIGKNSLSFDKKQSALGTFFEEFKSPLTIILLLAAITSLAIGSTISGILIIIIIFVSALLDFSVSYKSQKAASLLAKRVSPKTIVIRSGKELNIESIDIVPGDIVKLFAGSVVPADGTIVSSCDLYVDESSLTGESLPVIKATEMNVYMGSGVISGEAFIRISAIGHSTKFASIVSLLSVKERKNEFEKGIRSFSFLITKIVIILCICIFLINVVFKQDILSSLLFSLALAVGVTPELLPMIIAVNLSRASIKMSKQGIIVKKLSSIENFGSMDILCTDKTGTLTENKIVVVEYLDINGNQSDSVIETAYINSQLLTNNKTPLDAAIIEHQVFSIDKYKKINEIPFDFERKRDSLIVQIDNKQILITKGSPEDILNVSDISKEDREKAILLFEKLSKDGYRVIAVATKTFYEIKDIYTKNDEKGLIFSGFIAFIDPPKFSVKAVLEDLCKKSITIKVITGDHKLISEKIVKDVGIESLGTLDGQDLENLSDEELKIRCELVTIFSRVTPAQKNRIIMAFQSNGHVVGYMGDGINDAPSLRTADIGISVENAVDVAKESADIVLVSKNLDRLVIGVSEGRRVFANTMKYIYMSISSNFGNMISMTAASIFLPFLPMLPTQLLLNNILYESSQLTLIYDNVDTEILAKPNPWNISFIKRFMITFGLLSSLFDFAIFFILYKVFLLSGSSFQTGWFLQSFLSQVFVIFFIRSAKSIWQARRPHILVIISAVFAVSIAWAIALSSVGKIFGFTAISFNVVLIIVAITVCYFMFVELLKDIFYKRQIKLSQKTC